MASYKDILKLIREGKTMAEIREAMPMSPYYFRRLLCRTRLDEELKLDRDLAVQLSVHRLSTSQDRLMQRRLEIVESEDDRQAEKTAEKLVEAHGGTVIGRSAKARYEAAAKDLDREQKINFIKQLVNAQEVGMHLLYKNRETGKLGFEESIENTDSILAQIDRGERLSWNRKNEIVHDFIRNNQKQA